jgi:hypothetical protein
MNKSKVMVVALAAAILASGGSIAGSVSTATPAEAATVISTASATAPIGLRTYPYATGNMVQAMWSAPTNVVGTVTGYTLTLKQTGKADRILTSKGTSIVLGASGELAENTAYTLQVKANIVSKTGVKSVSPTASVQFKTSYALTTVKVSAPTYVKTVGVTANSLVASWGRPSTTVGAVSTYTVKLKRGDTVVKTVTVPFSTLAYNFTSLTSNTSYTIEVTATAVSFRGGNKATSVAAKAAGVTAKSSVVAVAKPVVTVTSVATNTAKITWTKPAVTGQIRAYLIFVTETGTTRSMKIGEYSGTTTSAQLQSVLKPNTTYTVSVVAMAHSEDGKNMASSGTNVVFTTKR